MSEEKAKLKDEFNNNVSTNNEISISYEIEQNKIQNSDNINNNGVYLTYGKYKIFTYDSKGDPLFLIGPDYMFFIAILVINLIYFLFLSFLLILCSSFYVSIIGVLLNIIQIGSTFICGIINPGLPKKELQNEQLLINEPNRYKRCNYCFFIIDKSKHYVHCERCECCCEGYDHHCPWTSKCVGRGNIFYFYGMLAMVSIVFVYLIIGLLVIGPKK